jgi:hypothetical protein
LPGFPITPASRLFYPSIDYAGSGRLEIASLSVDEARFSVAGSGSAELTVDDDAQVSIMRASDLQRRGARRRRLTPFLRWVHGRAILP